MLQALPALKNGSEGPGQGSVADRSWIQSPALPPHTTLCAYSHWNPMPKGSVPPTSKCVTPDDVKNDKEKQRGESRLKGKLYVMAIHHNKHFLKSPQHWPFEPLQNILSSGFQYIYRVVKLLSSSSIKHSLLQKEPPCSLSSYSSWPLPPSSWQPLIYFLSLQYPFLVFHWNKITWYVTICAWLLWLSKCLYRFSHIVAQLSFLFPVQTALSLKAWILSVSVADGQRHCFHVDILSNVPLDICAHGHPLCTPFSFLLHLPSHITAGSQSHLKFDKIKCGVESTASLVI